MFIDGFQLLSVGAIVNSTLSKIKIHLQIFSGDFQQLNVDTIVNSTLHK